MPADAPYPFPGLNPYFEERWFEVHPSLIVYARNQMQRQVPHGLHVSIEHGMTISGQPPLVDDNRQPDVSVWKLREDALLATAPPNYAPPIICKVIGPKPRHLAVREKHDGKLITIIEFLSPTNKHGGGAISYGQKRQSIMAAGVNLVEVDLVRKWGLALLLFEGDSITDSVRGTDNMPPSHAITVSRSDQPFLREIYPINYPLPLPACKVPLRPDDSDIWLDLQNLAEQCHADIAFDSLTDYTRAPEPPLTPEDSAWLDAHLKAQGLR